jgi:predicted acylesterase/phospholipase RssA
VSTPCVKPTLGRSPWVKGLRFCPSPWECFPFSRSTRQSGPDSYKTSYGEKMEKALGLVMTGGGARGAYQAGVFKRIGEMKWVQTSGNPFPIIGGASAGAINGTALAAGSDDFSLSTEVLAQVWSDLKPSDVFRCDVLSQAHNAFTWIVDLSFGALLGGGNARSLLDATLLTHFLNTHLRCERIQNNIRQGHLYALAISATNYSSGKSYLFIQGLKGHPMWNRSRRVTLATKITVDHVRASAAIPLVFQPVRLKTARGTAFFGDGCVRLQQPLSPVIRLGQRRFLPSASAAKISSIRKNPRIKVSLRWHRSWEFFVMSCFWTTSLPTSSTLSG